MRLMVQRQIFKKKVPCHRWPPRFSDSSVVFTSKKHVFTLGSGMEQ